MVPAEKTTVRQPSVTQNEEFEGGTASMMPPKFGFQDQTSVAIQLRKGFGTAATSFPYLGEIVGATTVALRSKPSKDPEHPLDNILADIPKGATVTVAGKTGGWLKVDWEGQSGYVSQEFIKPKSSTPVPKAEVPQGKLPPKDYFTWDPASPERITIKAKGITVGDLAQDIYGGKQHIDGLHHVPILEYKPSVDDVIPMGTTIRIEYRFLKPELQKVYDGSVPIASRADWGAMEPDRTKPDYTPYNKPLEDVYHSIAIHMSGNSNKHTMKDVEKEHRDPAGEYKLGDVGYHYGVDLQGKVFQGRPLDVKGSHVDKGNTGVIGIVFLADLEPGHPDWLKVDFDDDTLQEKMEASMLSLVHFLVGKYPGITHLGGHNEFNSNRTCPGDMAIKKLSSWRSATGLALPKKIN
jgi:hypothetical protein